MLDAILEPFVLKAIFDKIAGAKLLGEDLLEDLSFLRAMGRFMLPPLDRPPRRDGPLFPEMTPFRVPALEGKKIGLVATGGSGAMASAIGVMRACEEAGLEIAAISGCSGSALCLAPIAAGLDARETGELVLGWRTRDYLEPRWSELLKVPLALGRDFTGVISGDAVEQLLERHLGPVRLGELPIPFYTNIWDMNRNDVHHWGTRNRPELRLAQVVRIAVSLPPYIRPLELDGMFCADGGIVNIFPVDPLVDNHPEIDFFVGVNAFHPENFTGEDATGAHQKTFALLRASTQTAKALHLEVARQQLRRIADRCVMCHPVPYQVVRGAKFFEQFLDRSRWPEFITAGYHEGVRALKSLAA
jgi:NTE family protein